MRLFDSDSTYDCGQSRIKTFMNRKGNDTGLSILLSTDYSFLNEKELLFIQLKNGEIVHSINPIEEMKHDAKGITVSQDFSRVAIPKDSMHTKTVFDLLLPVFQNRLILSPLCVVGVHAAVVVHHHQAILFCGLPGAGKSTQAHLWEEHSKAWALNYDKPGIIIREGKAYVFGTPWSGKEPCYINCEVPIKALVFVEKAQEIVAERLSQRDAFARMYFNFMPYPLSVEIFEPYERKIKEIVGKVPVYNLKCTISEESVRVMYKELFGSEEQFMLKKNEKAKELYKANQNFMLRDIAGEYLVIPRGRISLDFAGTILLNETGAFLWKQIEISSCSMDKLASLLTNEFDIDYDTSLADVEKFVFGLLEQGLVEKV